MADLYKDAHGNTFQLDADSAERLGYTKVKKASSDSAHTADPEPNGNTNEVSLAETKKEAEPSTPGNPTAATVGGGTPAGDTTSTTETK